MIPSDAMTEAAARVLDAALDGRNTGLDTRDVAGRMLDAAADVYDEIPSQNGGLPYEYSGADEPGGYVCGVPARATADGITTRDGRRICGVPVESAPCHIHAPAEFAEVHHG